LAQLQQRFDTYFTWQLQQRFDILLGATSAKIRHFTWRNFNKDSIFYLAQLQQRNDISLGATSAKIRDDL
jgi:hypothetical protein